MFGEHERSAPALPVVAPPSPPQGQSPRHRRVFSAFPRALPGASAAAAVAARLAPSTRRRRSGRRTMLCVAVGLLVLVLAAVAVGAALWRELLWPAPAEEPLPAELTLRTPLASVAELDQYECVAWRATANCSRDGERRPSRDRSCSHVVAAAESGYCEFRHRATGHRRRLMTSACDSPASSLALSCDDAPSLARYNLLALEYVPTKPLSVRQNRRDLARDNPQLGGDGRAENEDASVADLLSQRPAFFRRGIAIVVYNKLLVSVFASVRSLRELGCSLPIELWYRPSELPPTHAVLQALVKDYDVFLRVVEDDRATKYFSKVFAVAYSAFDQVLFLDADNYPVRDPEYLFESRVFNTTGAVFWPDFWRPSRTTFDVTRDSFVWELLGVEFVDMFEQESGQLLVDRRRHTRALTALLHYALSSPNYIQELKLLWGDKDLFRMAWLRTQSPFHMIERPAGSAGQMTSVPTDALDPTADTWPDAAASSPSRASSGRTDVFCGFTMVQHDPDGDVLFLHRNSVKLRWGSHKKLWTHIQQLRRSTELRHYAPGEHKDRATFPDLNTCWGKFADFAPAYSVLPIAAFPFDGLEDRLIAFVEEAEPLVCTWPFFCSIWY